LSTRSCRGYFGCAERSRLEYLDCARTSAVSRDSRSNLQDEPLSHSAHRLRPGTFTQRFQILINEFLDLVSPIANTAQMFGRRWIGCGSDFSRAKPLTSFSNVDDRHRPLLCSNPSEEGRNTGLWGHNGISATRYACGENGGGPSLLRAQFAAGRCGSSDETQRPGVRVFNAVKRTVSSGSATQGPRRSPLHWTPCVQSREIRMMYLDTELEAPER
jgi:hypothetical protein